MANTVPCGLNDVPDPCMTPAPSTRKANAKTPVPAYPMKKSSRAETTEVRVPDASSLASVHSELQTAMSMAEGIQPTSASRNANGTRVPAAPPGHVASVPKSTRGSVTTAAASVETASSTRITLTAMSSTRNRPNHSSTAHAAMSTPAVTASDQSSPSANFRRNAVNTTTADCTISDVSRVITR